MRIEILKVEPVVIQDWLGFKQLSTVYVVENGMHVVCCSNKEYNWTTNVIDKFLFFLNHSSIRFEKYFLPFYNNDCLNRLKHRD